MTAAAQLCTARRFIKIGGISILFDQLKRTAEVAERATEEARHMLWYRGNLVLVLKELAVRVPKVHKLIAAQ